MKTAVVAFSGGLDTSFLVPYSREKYGLDRIYTVTVNTGGFDDRDLEIIAARAKEVGSDGHTSIDAQGEFYDSIIKYLIYGNVTRDGYPLCVGSERLIQGIKALEVCKEKKASMLLHGSTGAGNDQYRFDLVGLVLGGSSIQCLAPVRDGNFSRAFETEYLQKRGIHVAERNTKYSYNVGLWGVSIGGGESHRSSGLIPEEGWQAHPDPEVNDSPVRLTFAKGELRAVQSQFGVAENPVEGIKLLRVIGDRYGIGRHYHIGSSIPGKKARLGYQSPAADLIYEAHRVLEKSVLTQTQITLKRTLGEEFGRLVHEAKFFDPVVDDIKAFLAHSQGRVEGEVTLHLTKGGVKAVTVESRFDLLSTGGSVYGEQANFYSGADAAGASRLHSYEQVLYRSLEGKWN